MMAVAALLFAALTGIGAIIRIPLSPVPATMQVLFVLLSGLVLGPVWGPVSQALYLAMGTCGAPFFAAPPHAGPAVLFGPTGGYLWGFILASAAAGLITGRNGFKKDRSARKALNLALACAAGIAAIYLAGASWLGTWLGINGKSPFMAYRLGIKPFILIDMMKAVMAAALAWTVPRRWFGLG
ncbi:MAG: biotin transporter BioY [Actinobacteria bacterium]|nr:biotin transporter BioY [Actinomycetota bacterium]